jgi:uncharacterized protein (TIGR02594 family)
MAKLPVIPWIEELKKVLGWHEVRDREKLARWLKSDGATLGDPSKLPWCGDAMDTALALALPNETRPGDLGKNPYWALNWQFLGKKAQPCYGAIGAFKRPSGGHVGVLVGQDASAYCVLGGNQSDAIGYTWIDKGRLVDARWPLQFANPRVVLPILARNGKPLSQNEA